MSEAEKMLLSIVAKEGPEVIVAVAHLVRDALTGASAAVIQSRAERIATLKGFKIAVAVMAEHKREELQAKQKAR